MSMSFFQETKQSPGARLSRGLGRCRISRHALDRDTGKSHTLSGDIYRVVREREGRA